MQRRLAAWRLIRWPTRRLDYPGKGFQFCECPTRYSWNGEEGMGHFERITQLRFLRATDK
jgi:hypothetical protein